MWVGVCLCICAAVMRLSIRLACFQKLHTEDVLMILALSIMITNATVLHIWIGDIYTMIHVQNGYAVSFDFLFERIPLATRATGIVVILSNVGIWTIKLNFMAFFYRLGHQIKIYRICWWVALAGVVGCGAAVLGVVPYHCLFGNIVYVVQTCLSTEGTSNIYNAWRAGIAVDVVSDVISKFARWLPSGSPFRAGFRAFAVADAADSPLLSHHRTLENQNCVETEVGSVEHLLIGGVHHHHYHHAWKYHERRGLPIALGSEPRGPGHHVDALLASDPVLCL